MGNAGVVGADRLAPLEEAPCPCAVRRAPWGATPKLFRTTVPGRRAGQQACTALIAAAKPDRVDTDQDLVRERFVDSEVVELQRRPPGFMRTAAVIGMPTICSSPSESGGRFGTG